MTAPTKALLFDLRAYLADNNLRRSVASFSVNYGSTSEALSLQTFIIEVSDVVSYTTPMNPSAATMLRTSIPVDVAITFRNSSTLSIRVSKLLVLDADIATLSITNPAESLQPAKITLLQG